MFMVGAQNNWFYIKSAIISVLQLYIETFLDIIHLHLISLGGEDQRLESLTFLYLLAATFRDLQSRASIFITSSPVYPPPSHTPLMSYNLKFMNCITCLSCGSPSIILSPPAHTLARTTVRVSEPVAKLPEDWLQEPLEQAANRTLTMLHTATVPKMLVTTFEYFFMQVDIYYLFDILITSLSRQLS